MKTFWTVFVSVIVTAILVGGASYYYLSAKADKNNTTLQQEIENLRNSMAFDIFENVSVAPADQTAATTGWQTYSDNTHGVSLKYPANWPTASLSTLKASTDGPYWEVDSDALNFTDDSLVSKSITRAITIAKLSAFTNDADKNSVEIMKKIYADRSADGASNVILPKINAQMAAKTTPKYIETSDGKFRGIYYFANIGQDYSTMIDCIIEITDNTNILQFHFARPSDQSSYYESKLGEHSPFINYVNDLTENSDETICKEFLSTYRYITGSLLQIEISDISNLTVDQLKGAEYLVSGSTTKKYRLTDGKFSYKCTGGPTCTTTIADTLTAFGDLNGDGINDAAVVLVDTTAGTGTVKSLNVLVNIAGEPSAAGVMDLEKGDITKVSITGGIISVEMNTYASADPECCPTIKKTVQYKLSNGVLVKFK